MRDLPVLIDDDLVFENKDVEPGMYNRFDFNSDRTIGACAKGVSGFKPYEKIQIKMPLGEYMSDVYASMF